MIFNKREYIIDSTGIIYDTFMYFNYLEDMKEFYEIKNKELRIYIDKYDKLKQLVINIALYLGTIDKERLIFDEEKYILYTNILSFMEEAEKFNRNFDIEKFFSKQSWIKKCEKIGNNKSFKIEIDNREFIQYSYKIIYSSKEEIIGKNEKEYAKIDLKNKNLIWIKNIKDCEKMKKYIKKSLLLTDQDILHSLLYNIKLSFKKSKIM